MSDRKKLYLLAKLPVLNLLFALGYALLVQVGMTWSSLTSQVSLIWPAAGFALFGLLIFGLRIAPGLFVGAFGATLFLHLIPELGNSRTAWSAAFLMSGADLLQALIIARINQGLLNRNLLVNLPRTLVFIASVFICTLISSSLGTATLSYLGVVPAAEMGRTWAYWWMGDSIGMLMFTAMLAWLLIPRVRNNIHSQAFLVLCIGVGLVFFLVAALGYIEHSQNQRWLSAAREITFSAEWDELPWYQPSWLQISALAIGLSLIGLLSAYIRTRQQHEELLNQNQRKLEEEVLSQTQALRKANDWLLNEVVQRQQAQEQLQASQQALRAREEHLRSLLDNIPDPVWFKNLQGIYISCNKAFAEMFDLSEAEIVGKSEEQIVSPELAELFQRNDQATL